MCLTKCIYHKGFSGNSNIVAHTNFRIGGQDGSPQSLTAHTLNPQTAQKPIFFDFFTRKRW